MKLVSRIVLPGLICLATSLPSFASEDGDSGAYNSTADIKAYLLNLGSYLGFNLKNNPASTITVSQSLLNLNSMQGILNLAMNSWFGSLLVNTAGNQQDQQAFMPSSVQNYSLFNGFANFTFKSPAYSTPSQSGVSVSSLIDQQPYQADPVSQALLNILSTPDYSYCLNNDGTAVASCSYGTQLINENQVMINTVGTIPSANDYFSAKQVQPLLTQLNSNSLISPLMYSMTASSGSSVKSPFSSPIIGDDSSQNQGLSAQSQAQQAANYIRYVTAAVMPLQKPNRVDYDNLYIKAINPSGNFSQLEQQKAAATLSYYLNNLRVFTAQSSVAISNLYYILSKRMPQNTNNTGGNSQPTSQALSEFSMATWRLYNPNNGNNQWLAQIDKASPATVNKEVAALLAEMNYQLYLNRQVQERILLTNSIMILQNAQANQPNPSFDITANSVTNTPNQ